MKIAMVGTGYVGLVSGACLADFGHEVVCIDKDQDKIDRLRGGIMPIYEPGLDALVENNVRAGRLERFPHVLTRWGFPFERGFDSSFLLDRGGQHGWHERFHRTFGIGLSLRSTAA